MNVLYYRTINGLGLNGCQYNLNPSPAEQGLLPSQLPPRLGVGSVALGHGCCPPGMSPNVAAAAAYIRHQTAAASSGHLLSLVQPKSGAPIITAAQIQYMVRI